MNQEFSLTITICTNKLTKKPEVYIKKKIVDLTEIKILCNLLLENEKLLLPLIIEDKLQFYAKLKEKKII